MKKFSFIFLICSFSFQAFSQTSFYDLTITSITGEAIDFAAFKNKKVLIVNTALNSPDTSQLLELDQLYKYFKDTGLVIIAVPSNDFSNEPKQQSEIAQLYKNRVSFIIAAKVSVKGSAASALYKWLSQKSENGIINQDVKRDFQKFLINKRGQLIGIFSGKLWPYEILKNVIRNSN